MSKIKKIERRIVYDNNTERLTFTKFDEEGKPELPEMSKRAMQEWQLVYNWFEIRGVLHLLDMNLLRDHCISVSKGDKKSAFVDLNKIISDKLTKNKVDRDKDKK